MSIREKIQNNPTVGIAIAAVIFVIVIVRACSIGGEAVPTGQYYLDLDTGELFTRDTDQLPPIEAPSGGQGVLAYVFACGSCDDESNRFIAYVEKYADRAKANLESPHADDQSVVTDNGRLIRDADGGAWMNANDPNAARIMNIRDRCPGGGLTKCRP